MGDVVNLSEKRKTGRALVKTLAVPRRPWRELKYQDIGGLRPDKSVLIVRYGGFGDMIMVSTILPQLKEEGYHVTVNTTPSAAEVIRTDPHVDEILLQDTGQVPNAELKDYWAWLRYAFGRLIQLSESIESNLLPAGPRKIQGSDGGWEWTKPEPAFEWDYDKRQLLLNRNYIEETHRLAGVPFERQRTAFYPTISEEREVKAQVAKWKRKKGISKLVMVVWSGSSVHKAYPWMDNAIATVLTQAPEVGFVTAGDEVCQIFDEGWANESRIIKRAGKDSIRKTLVLAQHCDMVVGPETGVLNAVSMNPDVAKVVFLSHSSVENFCKHWVNTRALYSTETPCYPCHQMHFSIETCHQCPVSHGAKCQAEIPFSVVAEAIMGKPVERGQRVGE